jgi:hypothetical protein
MPSVSLTPGPQPIPEPGPGAATRDILASHRRSMPAAMLARELLFSEHVLNEDDQARDITASAEVWATLAIAEVTMTAVTAIQDLAKALRELT